MQIHKLIYSCFLRIEKKGGSQEAEVGKESARSLHPTPGGMSGAEVPADEIPEQCGRRASGRRALYF